jgi:hypothetical protein
MDLSDKEYAKAFLLEPTKLERLLEVVHERLSDHPDTTIEDRFQVFMSGNRCDEVKSLQEALALENSKKYKIERLRIVSSASTAGAAQPEYEVQVDFGVVKKMKNVPTAAAVKLVTVDVSSDVPSWNRQTLSQVEEQVERTWLRQTAPVVSLLILVLLFSGFFLMQLAPLINADSGGYSRIMWLDDKELDKIQKIVDENRTMTDAEMREITTGQLSNVLLYLRPKPEPHTGLNRLLLFFGVPFLLLVGVVIVLVTTCYPTVVFLWGDEVRHYDTILQRRKILWGLIVTILAGGIISKLLSEGVISMIPK